MAVSLGKLFATLGLDTREFDRAIGRFQSNMGKVASRMKSIGKRMTMAVTLPIVAIGGATVKMSADFEASMSKITGLVGVASEEVQAMRKDVLDLAGDTARAPQELADALFFVTSAGLRGADALDVLEKSARASAAGLGDTKDVADLVTSAVNAYGIENLNAAQATDTLVAAVREGKAEAPALAQSLGQVLPIASNLGVTFDQIGAAVAAMTRTGTDAATASIQLRQILASLLKPAEQSEKAFEEMGTSSAELRKQLREKGLVSVLGFLRKEMENNEQAMALAFPNVRALSGALDIMGANAEENVGIFQRMTDNTGSLDAAFNAASNTASFKFNQALAELKVVGIEIGAKLTPIFLKVANLIKNVVTGFSNLSSTAQNSILALAGIAAALGPVLYILGTIGGILAGLSLPIVGVIAGIAAIAAAWIYLSENWEAVKERLSDWDWWRNALIDALQFLITFNPISGLITAINELAKFLGKDLNIPDPFEMIADSLDGLKSETKEYEHQFGSFTDAIKAKAEQAKNALSGLFAGGGGSGGTQLSGTGAQTAEAQPSLISAPQEEEVPLLEDFDQIQLKIDETVESAFNMGKVFKDIFSQTIPNAAVQMTDAIGGALVGMENGFMNVANAALGSIQQIINALLAQAIAAMIAGEAVKGLPGLIAAGIGIAAVKALFSKHTKVGDALITSSGSIIEFSPQDNILAMKDFSNLNMPTSGSNNLSVRFSMRELIIEMDEERKRMGR